MIKGYRHYMEERQRTELTLENSAKMIHTKMYLDRRRPGDKPMLKSLMDIYLG